MVAQINIQAAALSAAKSTIAALERTQGAEDNADVSAEFEIHDTVVAALPIMHRLFPCTRCPGRSVKISPETTAGGFRRARGLTCQRGAKPAFPKDYKPGQSGLKSRF
jgi:hypothetical protein